MAGLVYLVRHGQSEWNIQRRTQGQIEHPTLTDLGRRQSADAAARIAEDLAQRGVCATRLISSDLQRAVQTAACIGDQLGLGYETDVQLREQHLGWAQGRSYAQTEAAADEYGWWEPTASFGGGESLQQVRDRVAELLAELAADAVTILVSHGDTIRATIAHWEGCSRGVIPPLSVPNGAVARFDGTVSWL